MVIGPPFKLALEMAAAPCDADGSSLARRDRPDDDDVERSRPSSEPRFSVDGARPRGVCGAAAAVAVAVAERLAAPMKPPPPPLEEEAEVEEEVEAEAGRPADGEALGGGDVAPPVGGRVGDADAAAPAVAGRCCCEAGAARPPAKLGEGRVVIVVVRAGSKPAAASSCCARSVRSWCCEYCAPSLGTCHAGVCETCSGRHCSRRSMSACAAIRLSLVSSSSSSWKERSAGCCCDALDARDCRSGTGSGSGPGSPSPCEAAHWRAEPFLAAPAGCSGSSGSAPASDVGTLLTEPKLASARRAAASRA